MSLTSSSISLSVIEKQEHLNEFIRDANVTRYLTVAGLVVLLYDHIITFRAEMKLIWHAPRSFAKYAFLFNRYLVPACLVAISYEMCGFSASQFTDDACQKFLFTLSMLAICSIGMANLLVLMRVVVLWDENKTVARLMTAGFLLSFCATFFTLVSALCMLLPGIQYSHHLNMCIITTTSPLLIATWASPMVFDILVLLSTIYNTLSRPRDAHIPLRKALVRDGISFFVGLMAFRALNLALVATLNPGLTMLGVYFVWACITTLLNRSLLSLRRAELDSVTSESSDRMGLSVSGRASPFGLAVPQRASITSSMDLNINIELETERKEGKGKGGVYMYSYY